MLARHKRDFVREMKCLQAQRSVLNRLIGIAHAHNHYSVNRCAYAANCEINGGICAHNWWLIIYMTQLVAALCSYT